MNRRKFIFSGLLSAMTTMISLPILSMPRKKAATLIGSQGQALQILSNSVYFNGMVADMSLRIQHLGDGYRSYNLALMRFHAQDSMSPFHQGGANTYIYVFCDPINLFDNTEHCPENKPDKKSMPINKIDELSGRGGVFNLSVLSKVNDTKTKYASTGGFKKYQLPNGAWVYLSKNVTDHVNVSKAMLDGLGPSLSRRVTVFTGRHGAPDGEPSGIASKFLMQDARSRAIYQQVARKQKQQPVNIVLEDIGKQDFRLKMMARTMFAKPNDSLVFAYCHSGLSKDVRQSIGLGPVTAKWRWHK